MSAAPFKPTILDKIQEKGTVSIYTPSINGNENLPEELRLFDIEWPRNRQSIRTTRQELFQLEKDLRDKHGISGFEQVMFGGRAVVLVSGDKVVQLSRKPLAAANFPEANPLLAQGRGGDNLHYAIFKYIPEKLTDDMQAAALQASLYAGSGHVFTDHNSDKLNYKVDKKSLPRVNEDGEKSDRDTAIPMIVDVEDLYFEKPVWDTVGIAPSVIRYMRSALADRAAGAPANSVVSTLTHDVFFFENEKLLDMFRNRIGQENCRDGLAPPAMDEAPKASYFQVPMRGISKDVFVLAVPHEMDTIEIGNDKAGYVGKFSLRLLMEEIMQNDKSPRL